MKRLMVGLVGVFFVLRLDGAPPETDPVVHIAGFVDAGRTDLSSDMALAVRDLLVGGVSEVSSIRLVDRETLDALLVEQGLGLQGLVAADSAARVGQILGADRMVTGSVWLRDEELTVTAHVIDVSTAVIHATCVATGPPAQLLDIMTALAADLARALDRPFDPGAVGAIDTRPIASLNFLRGLGYYHAGNFDRAIMDFMVCGDLDPDRHDRHYWMGRAFMAMGEHEHARIELLRFLETDGASPVHQDARQRLEQNDQHLREME